MTYVEPPPGSVLFWFAKYGPASKTYQYVAVRVDGRGWYVSDTAPGVPGRGRMWTEVLAMIGPDPVFMATRWMPLAQYAAPTYPPRDSRP